LRLLNVAEGEVRMKKRIKVLDKGVKMKEIAASPCCAKGPAKA
jgi:hypothetical protein